MPNQLLPLPLPPLLPPGQRTAPACDPAAAAGPSKSMSCWLRSRCVGPSIQTGWLLAMEGPVILHLQPKLCNWPGTRSGPTSLPNIPHLLACMSTVAAAAPVPDCTAAAGQPATRLAP